MKVTMTRVVLVFLVLIVNLSYGSLKRAIKEERLEDEIRDLVDEWEMNHKYNHTAESTSELPTETEDFENTTDTQLVGLPARNCSQCGSHKETRAKRIDAQKAMILSKLGLSEAPNITYKGEIMIPPLMDYLDGLNQMQSDSPASLTDSGYPFGADSTFVPGPVYGDDDDYHVDTEKVYIFSEEPLLSWNQPKEEKYKYFKFASNLYNSHVAEANLWVYLRPHNILRDLPFFVDIYQVARDQDGKGHNFLQAGSKKVKRISSRGRWVSIDIKKLVTHWFRHPNDNLGLVIRSFDSEGQNLTVVDSSGYKNRLVPFIEMKLKRNHHKRTKRMVGLNCEENSNEVRCCRYPLTVDFEEFGWDWIIAPKRYEANYCSGECPFSFLQKYAHTHLVQQANPQGSAGPCCAPRKMSSISMLYFNDKHTIIYGTLPGMVVERCGCS